MSLLNAMSDTGAFTVNTKATIRWPREDEIRWVEWELLRSRHAASHEKSLSPLADRPLDLQVWLAKARDKKSWNEIGELYFAKARTKREARRSEARRSYDRVELYLKEPNSPVFQDHTLHRLIWETFGVSAQDFRLFILKGHLPRTKK
jgi:hypothetical protein